MFKDNLKLIIESVNQGKIRTLIIDYVKLEQKHPKMKQKLTYSNRQHNV